MVAAVDFDPGEQPVTVGAAYWVFEGGEAFAHRAAMACAASSSAGQPAAFGAHQVHARGQRLAVVYRQGGVGQHGGGLVGQGQGAHGVALAQVPGQRQQDGQAVDSAQGKQRRLPLGYILIDRE
ncbi:hypothetical protein LP419_06935 [Massilia sp. H-1]|nr:hypothetical protein LP419_06935 [Massilia sp. H-1]